MSAIISNCGKYRYRLDRELYYSGIVIAYFGVNPSTADASIDDQTIRKLKEFTNINGGRKLIIGNVFAYRSKNVKNLPQQQQHEVVGLCNDIHLRNIINDADILIPCWGNKSKVHKRLHFCFDELMNQLLNSNKPVYTFGFTKSGDPKHPLMLSYETKLIRVRKPKDDDIYN